MEKGGRRVFMVADGLSTYTGEWVEDQGTRGGGILRKSWKAALMSQGVSEEGSKRKRKHTHGDDMSMAKLNEKRGEL